MHKYVKILFVVLFLCSLTKCSDITNLVFGKVTDGLPAAFGDFNSDELTDVFVLRDDSHTVEILLAHEEEPLLRVARPDPLRCSFSNSIITSVVPGDFDGDALMDVLVTTYYKPHASSIRSPITRVYINWGGANYLNCSLDEEKPILEMYGEPLALDYNQDMIMDLFGQDINNKKVFWVFNSEREYKTIVMEDSGDTNNALSDPHSNAFIDYNEDFMADLFLTKKDHFEIWYGNEHKHKKFKFNKTIKHPHSASIIGQSLFMDVELKGQMDLVTPICFDYECTHSALMVYSSSDNKWYDLQVNFNDDSGSPWRFYKNPKTKYTDVITLRSGDFNMDGYPDLLATLAPGAQTKNQDQSQSFLLENVPCQTLCGKFKRTFQIRWNILSPFKNGTAMAAFFDFYQDGILDVILVTYDGKEYKTAAYKNTLDYDANFIKVMVLTGLQNKNNPMIMGRVGKKRRTYGTNLPGPLILYKTTTQEGYMREGVSAQLPQSAHFSLNLPYTIFGIGRTPNFVDSLTVGLSNYSRTWTQIIPNSQMVVIPWPPNEPSRWKAQLFVTPSKLILMSVAALTGICGIITLIIGVLHWKERQEDKKERLSESHRFHFDAM